MALHQRIELNPSVNSETGRVRFFVQVSFNYVIRTIIRYDKRHLCPCWSGKFTLFPRIHAWRNVSGSVTSWRILTRRMASRVSFLSLVKPKERSTRYASSMHHSSGHLAVFFLSSLTKRKEKLTKRGRG